MAVAPDCYRDFALAKDITDSPARIAAGRRDTPKNTRQNDQRCICLKFKMYLLLHLQTNSKFKIQN